MRREMQTSLEQVKLFHVVQALVGPRNQMTARGKLHPPHLDDDMRLAWGIVGIIAFIGVAAVGVYAGAVSSTLMERTPIAQSKTGSGN